MCHNSNYRTLYSRMACEQHRHLPPVRYLKVTGDSKGPNELKHYSSNGIITVRRRLLQVAPSRSFWERRKEPLMCRSWQPSCCTAVLLIPFYLQHPYLTITQDAPVGVASTQQTKPDERDYLSLLSIGAQTHTNPSREETPIILGERRVE